MQGMSFLEGTDQIVLLIIAVMIEKLGGSIEITQEDIDRIAYKNLMERGNDGTLQISLMDKAQH